MKLSLPVARSITAAVVAALLAAGTVSAALFLILAPETGAPGVDVMGRTGGEGAFARSVVGPLHTYLAGEAKADGVTRPDDPALVDIGQLMIDRGGNGSIRFVVPDVAPGGYVVMVHCAPCAEFNAGRVMLGVATFEVQPKAPDAARLDGYLLRIALIAFGGLLLFGAITIATSRRRRSA